MKFKKGLDEISNKNKGVAFKAVKEAQEEDEDDEDEELGMIVRRFKKFYRKDQGFQKFHKEGSSNKRESKEPIICYECEKPGHIISECPQFKEKNKEKERQKFSHTKKKAYVSAIWGDSSSNEESEDEEIANICLVAQEESESEEVHDSEPTYDELLSEYNSLHSEFRRIAKELISSKRRIKILELEAKDIPQKCEKVCENCSSLEKKNSSLTKTLEKFTKGSEMLNVILNAQRFTNDRSGIGYDPDLDKKKGKKKKGERLYLNYFRKTVHSSNHFAHCTYCN